MIEPLHKAVDQFRSRAAFARAIGVSPQRVEYWLKKARRGVPAAYASQIEPATNGAVTAAQLPPDIFATAAAA